MLITKEMLEEAQEEIKNCPRMTPEEKAKLNSLGEKMRNLSPEERKELKKQAIEKYGII